MNIAIENTGYKISATTEESTLNSADGIMGHAQQRILLVPELQFDYIKSPHHHTNNVNQALIILID